MAEATPASVTDPERLAALERTGLLTSGPDEAFDRLTRLASRILRAPTATVTLVTGTSQVLKSCVGVPEPLSSMREMPLAYSFCKHALESRRPLVIRDAREHPLVRDSPAIRENRSIAYLGIPLVTAEGHALGTLCVLDDHPRDWTEDEIELLQELAASVMTEIELRAALRSTATAEHFAAAADRERREKGALLESSADGIYGIDREGRCTFLNPAGARMLGYTPEEVLGQNMHLLIHHTRSDGGPYPEEACPVAQAARRGESTRADDELLWRKDGSSFPVSYSSAPIRVGESVRGAVVTFSDITERKSVDEALRRREETQRFLAHTGATLAAASLDYREVLRSVARLAVPTLADWCSVFTRNERGESERLEIAHADPEREPAANRLRDFPTDQGGSHPALQVLRTGEPLLIEEIPDEMVVEVARDEEHLRILREVGMHSAMVVPLNARGRTLGALTLVAAESGRRFDEEQLAMAMEFAYRAALAADNARLLQESQEANRAKNEFLATISHELRTPLNALTGYASLMLEGIPEPLPEGSRTYVERISLSAQHLIQLIEEILTFSRLETGRETVSAARVDVADLVAEVRAIIEPLVADKRLQLVLDAPEEGLQLETDPRKLRQILLNLLDNAVKFTDEGEVRFRAAREGEEAVFEVQDSGIGIDPANQERIFTPFWQVEQSSTRSVGGTGLGLSVTHRLVELLGGSITLESAPGQGALFRVRLPLDRSTASSPPVAE